VTRTRTQSESSESAGRGRGRASEACQWPGLTESGWRPPARLSKLDSEAASDSDRRDSKSRASVRGGGWPGARPAMAPGRPWRPLPCDRRRPRHGPPAARAAGVRWHRGAGPGTRRHDITRNRDWLGLVRLSLIPSRDLFLQKVSHERSVPCRDAAVSARPGSTATSASD
jgi:hypothetical protein